MFRALTPKEYEAAGCLVSAAQAKLDSQINVANQMAADAGGYQEAIGRLTLHYRMQNVGQAGLAGLAAAALLALAGHRPPDRVPMTVKPADLRPGDRIVHTVPEMNGTITVVSEPVADIQGDPVLDSVCVDVEVSDASHAMSKWDPEHLPAGTGADSFRWLGTSPTLQYRLEFTPDVDVQVQVQR